MAGKPDYYSILGVEPDSTPAQISRAYRALMRANHPDVGSAAADSAELLRIMEAFAVLRDPARRKDYDSSVAGRRPEPGPDQSPAEGGAGSRRRSPRPQAGSQGSRNIPVRYSNRTGQGNEGKPAAIRVTPVRWESGPWS